MGKWPIYCVDQIHRYWWIYLVNGCKYSTGATDTPRNIKITLKNSPVPPLTQHILLQNTKMATGFKNGPPTCDVMVAISIFYTIYVKGPEKDEWRLFETVDHTKLLVETNKHDRSLPRTKSGAKSSYVPLWSKSWWRILCGLQRIKLTHGRNVKTWKWREICQPRPRKPFINQESHF